MTQRVLRWLFARVYRAWLTDAYGRPYTVVRVKGWRTALVDGETGCRRTITPCFWGLE